MTLAPKPRHGYRLGHRQMRPGPDIPVGQWWCMACRLLIEAPKNPITCDTCGGDTTMAPESARKK